ncbi:MAG: S8 family serine peptidase [Candidatus Eisenbacteria bacterium]|nr:S8 family serine peptidase [Candidatus Eisenbacteria bacterium]
MRLSRITSASLISRSAVICMTTLLIMLLTTPTLVRSLDQRCNPNVVLIRFEPGVVSFPPEYDYGHNSFELPLEDAHFTVPELEPVFLDLHVETFETVAPGWRHLTPEDMYDRHGNPIDLIDFTDVYRVKLDPSAVQDPEAIIVALKNRPGVAYVGCDQLVHLFSDPFYVDQWHLNNTGQVWPNAGPCDPMIDINAPEAWMIWDTAGTKIGIVDESIRPDHEDLVDYIDVNLSNSWPVGTFWYGAYGAIPWWHGSACAAIAAAGTDNGVGVAGVTNLIPNHSDDLIVALRIMDADANDPGVAAQRADAAFSYVSEEPVYPNVLVLNNSWGSQTYKNCFSYEPILRDACANAFEKDISLVCAAGNEPVCVDDPCGDIDTCFAYPAAFDDYCLAVGGIRCDGSLFPEQYRRSGSYIDLVAPGDDIYTVKANLTPSSYGPFGMTSSSAPQVSGAIALLMGVDPSLTNEDYYGILKNTTEDVGHESIYVGHGLMKLDRGLAAMIYPGAVIHRTTMLTDPVFVEEREQEFRHLNPGSRSEEWETYWVEVYKLEKLEYLWDPDYASIEGVWVRGKESTGAKNIAPHYVNGEAVYKYDARAHTNHADVGEYDHETKKVLLTTYAYKVVEAQGEQFVKWFPADPASGFEIAYTLMVRYLVGGGGKNILAGPEPVSDFKPTQLPSTGRASLGFNLGQRGVYNLRISDVTGRTVHTLLDDAELGPGEHRIDWNGEDSRGRPVAPGVYFATLSKSGVEGEEGRWTTRCLLLR